MNKTSADLTVGRSVRPIAATDVERLTRPVLPAVTIQPHAHAAASRDAALDTLRAFVIVLVVAHHSLLAYALISPNVSLRSPAHPWLAGIPIVDSHRLAVFDLFALFNDTFFMALMFLLSGLFVGPSLARKGTGSFLRERALRLGAPFVVMALLAPLAYYPAYRATAADPARSHFGANGCRWESGRAGRCGSSLCCSGSTSSRPRCIGSLPL
jgi:peptidoglycan/LPS O-acetylase OafA/YrhL